MASHLSLFWPRPRGSNPKSPGMEPSRCAGGVESGSQTGRDAAAAIFTDARGAAGLAADSLALRRDIAEAMVSSDWLEEKCACAVATVGLCGLVWVWVVWNGAWVSKLESDHPHSSSEHA